jgi:photosystem II stability/assembly factor-like uncharacterized protein
MRLEDVQMRNRSLGWAVGGQWFGPSASMVLRTTNGGESWEEQASPVAVPLFGASFSSDSTGWAVGANGAIIRTRNAGSSWQTQTSPSAVDLYGVAVPNGLSGWAVGEAGAWNKPGTILRTTNGGSTWTTQTPPTTNDWDLNDIHAASTSEAWVVGVGGTVAHTTNGGSNWTTQPAGTTEDLNAVTFVGTQQGWAVGNMGVIRHTANGGSSWTSQTSPAGSTWLYDVTFIDQNNGWISGDDGMVMHTSDGGTNWTLQKSGVASWLFGIDAVDQDNVWAAGDKGAIIKTDMGGLPPSESAFWFRVSPGSQEVEQGEVASYLVQLYANRYQNAVDLSASGLPAGVTVSFEPTTTMPCLNPTSMMRVRTTGATPDGSHLITLTATGGGLTKHGHFVLKIGRATVNGNEDLVPYYPGSADTSSIVMMGGRFHRYFRLEQGSAAPTFTAGTASLRVTRAGVPRDIVRNVRHIDGAPGVVDISLATTNDATQIGSAGSNFTVEVMSLTLDGVPISWGGAAGATFPGGVISRQWARSWTFGQETAIGAGITAYVKQSAGCKMDYALDQDDRLTYSLDTLQGLGVGVSAGWDANVGGAARADAEAGIEGGIKMVQGKSFYFDDPFDSTGQKRSLACLTLEGCGLQWAQSGIPGMSPIMTGILTGLDPGRVIWGDYASRRMMGAGLYLTGSAGGSFGIGPTSTQKGKDGSDETKGFSGLNVSLANIEGEITALQEFSEYPKAAQYSMMGDQVTKLDLSLCQVNGEFGWSVPLMELAGVPNAEFTSFKEEMFFDKASPTVPQRVEMRLVDDEGDQEVKFTIVGADNIRSLGEHIGNISALASSLENPATAVYAYFRLGFIQYEIQRILEEASDHDIPVYVSVRRGTDITDITIPIQLKFSVAITIDLEESISYKKQTRYLESDGVWMDGARLWTTGYVDDSYNDASGAKDFGDIVETCFSGLWSYVSGFFSTLGDLVDGAADWLLGNFSLTPQRVGGRLTAVPNRLVPGGGWFELAGKAGSHVGEVTMTANSWNIPLSQADATAAGGQPIQHGLTIVGPVHKIDPEGFAFSSQVRLDCGYVDTQTAGIDEDQLAIFRYDPILRRWVPCEGSVPMPGENTVESHVWQLGTFAVGIDRTGPEITQVTPADDTTTSSQQPTVTALIGDGASALATTTIKVQIDSGDVPYSFEESTGLVAGRPATPLAAGSHTLRVATKDTRGNVTNVYHSFFVDLTAPGAPSSLTATSSSGRVVLGWSASSATDLSDYSVFRKGPMDAAFLPFGAAAHATFADSFGQPGWVYEYKVTAVDMAGNTSGFSNTVSIAFAKDSTPPAAVTNLVAAAGDNHVDLSWKNPTATDFSGVLVRRASDHYPVDFKDGQGVYGGTDQSAVDTDLANGTTYYYSVFAGDIADNFSTPVVAMATPKQAASLTGAPSPSVVSYNGATTIWGRLKVRDATLTGCTDVTLWRTLNGGVTWSRVATATWEPTSQTYRAVKTLTQSTRFQLRWCGDSTRAAAASPSILVRSRAYMTRPAVSGVRRPYRALTVTGYLKPGHTGFTRVYVQRRVRGSWRNYRTYWARNRKYSSSLTRYTATVRLPAGYWLVKGYHYDSGHYPTWSSPRVFVVR